MTGNRLLRDEEIDALMTRLYENTKELNTLGFDMLIGTGEEEEKGMIEIKICRKKETPSGKVAKFFYGVKQ